MDYFLKGFQYRYEIIFVDDGSKDNTNKLLHKYFGKKKNCRIIKHERNMNVGAAIRTGFNNATGEYERPLNDTYNISAQNNLVLYMPFDSATTEITPNASTVLLLHFDNNSRLCFPIFKSFDAISSSACENSQQCQLCICLPQRDKPKDGL